MDINQLITDLQEISQKNSISHYKRDRCAAAATALSTLQAENEEMQKKLNEFSEFLCHVTGGMLSKTNYTAQAMISAAEDYQQRVCDNYCDLRADLARVTAERDAVVERIREWEKFDTYLFIHNFITPEKWRGQKEG